MELSNIEVEANWCWARKHIQGKTKIVNLYYRRELLDSVKDKLSSIGEPLLGRFEEGCFGHFLGWKCGISNCQALNALIGRQIVSPLLPEYELWFRINETNIRFSFPEFALVTGLHFGASAFNPADPKHRASDTGVFQRFCGGKELDLYALWDLFKADRRPNEATDEDYLKVANLLFMYLFALGNDPRRKPDNFAWVLVDNLVAWNKFPWGAYCYRAFLHYFIKMKTLGQKYHFYGPAWSLQVWALEAIPSLANNIGKIADPYILPRCLKWTFKKSRLLDFHKLLNTVTECHVTLEARPEEKVQGYCTTSEDRLWQSVGYVEPVNILNLPADLPRPNVKRRNGKRKVPSDRDESGPIQAARRRKRRLNDKAEPRFSSTNHVCRIREDCFVEKIVEKLVARIVPKIIDYLKEHVVPDMIAMMQSLVAQQLRQPQNQPQSPLNHEFGAIGVVDRVKSEQPNPHPQPPVYGDGQQPQHVSFASEHVEIGGGDPGEPHQPRQQPPSVVESEKISGDVQGQSEQPIHTRQAMVNADQMHHTSPEQLPPSDVEPEKITVGVQSDQPIPTPEATVNADLIHHSSPTPQQQLSLVESDKKTGDVQSDQPIPTPQATVNADQMHHSSPTPQPQLNVSTELVKTMSEDSGIPNVVEAASTLRAYKRKRARLADVAGEVTTGSSTGQTAEMDLVNVVSEDAGITNTVEAASPGGGHQQRSLRPTDPGGVDILAVANVPAVEAIMEKRLLFKKRSTPLYLDRIMFDRLWIKRHYCRSAMSKFLNWYDHDRDRSKQTSTLMTPWELTSKQNLTPSWFKELYSSRHSITSQHCDALLNLLVYYRDEKYPRNAFLHDWTILESMATYVLMKGALVQREKEYITNHVEGKLPKQGPKPWSQIQKVYGIAQVEGNHWVLYAALLKEQTIMVFDTIGGSCKQEKVHEKVFAHMAANLATLCEACDVYKNCSYAKDLTPAPVWEVKYVHDTPVQINLHDCGVLAMKIMECLTTSEPVAAVVPEFCEFYRAAYCYELFTLSTVVSKTS